MIDLSYVERLKKAGASNRHIARRLAVSEEAVASAWARIEAARQAPSEGGREDFQAAAFQLRNCQKLLGLLLYHYTESTPCSLTEIQDILRAKPEGEDMAEYLYRRAIILKPFTPLDAAALAGVEKG